MTEERQQIDRISTEVSAQETLLDQALAAIANKAAGGGGIANLTLLDSGTFTVTSNTKIGSKSISHNAGKVPLAVRVHSSITGLQYGFITGVMINCGETGVACYCFWSSSTARAVTSSTSMVVNWTDSTITFGNSSTIMYKASSTYTWEVYG